MTKCDQTAENRLLMVTAHFERGLDGNRPHIFEVRAESRNNLKGLCGDRCLLPEEGSLEILKEQRKELLSVRVRSRERHKNLTGLLILCFE